jgi:hypothetical protein
MLVSVACKVFKDQPVQQDLLGLKAIPVTLALLDRVAQLVLPVPKAYLVRLALLGQLDLLGQKGTPEILDQRDQLALPDPQDQPDRLGQPDPQDQPVQIQQCQDQQGQQDQPDPQVPPDHRE